MVHKFKPGDVIKHKTYGYLGKVVRTGPMVYKDYMNNYKVDWFGNQNIDRIVTKHWIEENFELDELGTVLDIPIKEERKLYTQDWKNVDDLSEVKRYYADKFEVSNGAPSGKKKK